MAKKSVKNVVLFRLSKEVEHAMVSSGFCVDNAALVLSDNTVLVNGRRDCFKSISLENRHLDNLQTDTAEPRKLFKDTLINTRKIRRAFKPYALL